ncbi:MAG: type VI secretion system tip protein VgrG [Calditrichaeota bacterium]|nr:type VI secretion system tip protein VgrG [Calditrichota bacterium]
MVHFKHNQLLYKLACDALAEDALYVISFEGISALSQPFEYRFQLLSEDENLSGANILNKNATFTLFRDPMKAVKIHGIISHFEQHGRSNDYVFYHAVLVPRLWRLNLTRNSEVYQNLKVEDVVKTNLESSGLSSNDYKFSLNSQYDEMEYLLQFRESNLSFINRRLEHWGIAYHFEHRDNRDMIVFTDDNNSLPSIPDPSPVPFNIKKDIWYDKESMLELKCIERVITGDVQLRDYHYLKPQSRPEAEFPVSGSTEGHYYEYGGDYFPGDNFPPDSQSSRANLFARVRGEEIQALSKIFKGVTDCRQFQPGYKFTLKDHFRSTWNQEYVITHIRVKGNQQFLFSFLQGGGGHSANFNCDFQAIPASIPYRPPRITPVPQLPGVMSARIESASGDEYAYLDNQGRYRVRLLFDRAQSETARASLPVRLAQPYSGAGANYGIHFPNHADTEFIWACVNGDPDRPLGLGTVPNADSMSPVIDRNKSQNIIRTKAGNEMIMDDKTEEAQIFMTTPDANQMLFDDKDDKIDIITTNKHKMTMDDKNQNITVQTKDGHFLIMDDKNTKITLQSKNGHRISINDSSGGENITIIDASGENTFMIDITNKKLVIRTDNGSIDMHAPNGVIDIKATTLNVETSGDTTMKAANTSIEAQQDYDLKATNITEEASMDFKQKATNVTSEANMEHKSKGMNVTSEAGVNQTVKGSMVTVQSSGPNTIKGTPVMIN